MQRVSTVPTSYHSPSTQAGHRPAAQGSHVSLGCMHTTWFNKSSDWDLDWTVTYGRETVEVLVPRISISRRDYTTSTKKIYGGVGDADDDRDDRLSMQTKQMAMRKKAATIASLAAEDYSRKLEQGDFTGAVCKCSFLIYF